MLLQAARKQLDVRYKPMPEIQRPVRLAAEHGQCPDPSTCNPPELEQKTERASGASYAATRAAASAALAGAATRPGCYATHLLSSRGGLVYLLLYIMKDGVRLEGNYWRCASGARALGCFIHDVNITPCTVEAQTRAALALTVHAADRPAVRSPMPPCENRVHTPTTILI